MATIDDAQAMQRWLERVIAASGGSRAAVLDALNSLSDDIGAMIAAKLAKAPASAKTFSRASLDRLTPTQRRLFESMTTMGATTNPHRAYRAAITRVR